MMSYADTEALEMAGMCQTENTSAHSSTVDIIAWTYPYRQHDFLTFMTKSNAWSSRSQVAYLGDEAH